MSSGSTPPLHSGSRIASCSACIVRSLSSPVSRGFPKPLDISRSDNFDISSSMSSSSSRLGTYFEYLYFMVQRRLKPSLSGVRLVVILLLTPRRQVVELFVIVLRQHGARLL